MRKEKNSGNVPKSHNEDLKSEPSIKQQEILDRQKKVESLKLKMFTHRQIADILGVHENTIDRDVQQIKAKHLEEYKQALNDGKDPQIVDILQRYRMTQQELWNTHMSADGKDKSRVKIAAASAIGSLLDSETKLLQSLGFIPKEAEEIDRQVVNVFFNIKRPDRTKQLAERDKKYQKDNKRPGIQERFNNSKN